MLRVLPLEDLGPLSITQLLLGEQLPGEELERGGRTRRLRAVRRVRHAQVVDLLLPAPWVERAANKTKRTNRVSPFGIFRPAPRVERESRQQVEATWLQAQVCRERESHIRSFTVHH